MYRHFLAHRYMLIVPVGSFRFFIQHFQSYRKDHAIVTGTCNNIGYRQWVIILLSVSLLHGLQRSYYLLCGCFLASVFPVRDGAAGSFPSYMQLVQ